jgi:uncharacterized membrane protein YdjX (TVP38/TMEM64 family)
MYYILLILLCMLSVTIIYVNYKSFEIINHKFWIFSLSIINISILLFFIIFYYKKKNEPGARGFRGYKGINGDTGENYESCIAEN